MDRFTEEELAPGMAITGVLMRLIMEKKARIISRKEGKPINGRRMVQIEVELIEE